MSGRWISTAMLATLALAAGSARATDVDLGVYGGGTTRTQENDTLAPPGRCWV